MRGSHAGRRVWRLRLGVRQSRETRGRPAPAGQHRDRIRRHRIPGSPLARPAVTLYLFHLVRQLLDGRRLVCWMDEFWRLLADPAFENFAKDGPKTWRKLNGVMSLATQSASDVLDSPISSTLVEQTPTKVFFPNARCRSDEYTQGFGLSRARVQADQANSCSPVRASSWSSRRTTASYASST